MIIFAFCMFVFSTFLFYPLSSVDISVNKDSVFPKVAITTITCKFKTVCKYLYLWFNKFAPAIDWFFKESLSFSGVSWFISLVGKTK